MPSKPNPDAPLCECRWFERAARDDALPVVFDERMNEYHLVHTGGRGHSLFYHCPFCGGRAPDSLRKTYWTEVSIEESHRLHQLTKDITTPQQLFERFGEPDHDLEVGSSSMTLGSEDTPPETTLGPRRVVFRGLSDTADMHVRIDRYDRLWFSFMGRSIGPKQSDQASGDGDNGGTDR
ncbi:hypothetical protein [Verrucomicrobium sp. BvORR034]|uniref:DUF6980 family protein n=1 Tax=Verrucomicrobium sp. BvORR034 TaxID=1396418 RepID=UPI0022410384|nr:hypothetical protein [Verrucomicrobium sp. BvORR034]